LQNLVAACKYVVCRSGYSSVMDVVRWQKNALIIPTPGQFEQIYLAQYLSDKKWFYTLNQELFDGFNEENMKPYQCPANIEFETNFEAMFANF
jgi:predicted glycosyltransferase